MTRRFPSGRVPGTFNLPDGDSLRALRALATTARIRARLEPNDATSWVAVARSCSWAAAEIKALRARLLDRNQGEPNPTD